MDTISSHSGTDNGLDHVRLRIDANHCGNPPAGRFAVEAPRCEPRNCCCASARPTTDCELVFRNGGKSGVSVDSVNSLRPSNGDRRVHCTASPQSWQNLSPSSINPLQRGHADEFDVITKSSSTVQRCVNPAPRLVYPVRPASKRWLFRALLHIPRVISGVTISTRTVWRAI
jgi:hypothetical protein